MSGLDQFKHDLYWSVMSCMKQEYNYVFVICQK